MKRYKLLKDLPTFKAGQLAYISLIEEIEEPTDSIHWKPKKDDEYFWMNSYGETQPDVWDGENVDLDEWRDPSDTNES